MAKYESGTYEPADDIRAFDGGEDDFDEEGSRLPLLIVIALLVLAAFGGVVWLAYTQGVQKGREGAPRVITAEKGPLRTAPANPGGKTPYEGLKIYEQPAPPAAETAPAKSAPSTATRTKPAAKPAPKATPAAKPAAPAKVAKTVTAKPAPAKPVAQAPAATGGAYVLQIGAYKSEAEANAAWKAYQRRHPIVGGYTPDIKRVDLGAKGVWYRLRIGSFTDRAGASALCAKLKADGGGCFPAKS